MGVSLAARAHELGCDARRTAGAGRPMSRDPVRAIADAVLYEGYILWPYRRSALKNQRRFTFGGVYPPGHSEAHPDDPRRAQTQVLVRGAPSAEIRVTVRFLQVVRREVMRRHGDRLEGVDELVVDGQRHVTWEETVEREFTLTGSLEQLGSAQLMPIAIDAGQEREALGDAGAFVRNWRELRGELVARADALSSGVWRLTTQITNKTPTEKVRRQEVLEQTLCSTHLLLHATGGEFVS